MAIIYINVYGPRVGREVQIKIEEDNHHDARVVEVTKDGIVVGHLPQEAGGIVWYFLNRGGSGLSELRNLFTAII